MKQRTNRISLFLLIVLATELFIVSHPTPAHAENWIFDLGAGYMTEMGRKNKKQPSEFELKTKGFDVQFILGYKAIDWLIIALDQDLGRTWHEEKTHTFHHFYGITTLSANYYAVLKPVDFMVGIGLGAMYHGVWRWEFHDGNQNTRTYRSMDGGFALRLRANVTYMFTELVGVGIRFDYTFAAADYTYSGASWYDRLPDSYTQHMIDVQAHVRLAF